MTDSRHASEKRSLSDLLCATELTGQCWCYTDLIGASGFALPPGDCVTFHALIHGSARIACAGGMMSELAPGDAVMVLNGEAHALRSEPGSEAATHDFLRSASQVDSPASIACGKAGQVSARILSGRLRASWPAETNRAALPALLHVARGGEDNLLHAEALARAGIGPGSAALLRRLASLLLVSGLRAYPGCKALFAPAESDPVSEALLLIAANPSASWTVEKLARSVGMGRSSFAARFTQSVGRAPMEVVSEHRMEHAAALLRQGKLKIAEIAEMAGYGSEAAFSRRFSRHFGLSPSRMRDEVREAEEASSGDVSAFRPLLSGRLAMDDIAKGRGALSTTSASARIPAKQTRPRASGTFFLKGKPD